ncbi:MAG TPA: DinB family protein [Thermoanaerobaculia bacterium]|nr:DinB family protein [Thermoanaerobaculia bacterium]
MKVLRSLVILLALPTLAYARAQNTPRAQSNAAKPTGFKAEFLSSVDDIESKLMELAESTPAEKYSWRPAPGVRSIGEVYAHVAASNYFLCTFLGVDPPKRNGGDLEKTITKKADIVAELRRSFDHVRMAATNTSNLEKPVKMFGNTTSQRGVMITVLNHLHEHLGQSIAYARMNGVVPPWSR